MHLLVDARNTLYRAIHGVKVDRRPIKPHYFVAFMRIFARWIMDHGPDSVHVFWDAPRKTVWRRKILSDYKDRSQQQHYMEDITEDLAKTTNIAMSMFEHMGVRQYLKERMEADDLIYAAVSLLHPSKSIIVSTDKDMIQIPFVFESSTVYNPKKHEFEDLPDVHPVYQKALTGDKSDNIEGYYGIGPAKSRAMLQNQDSLIEFFEIKGKKRFIRNCALIDLSINPKLFENKVYVYEEMLKPIKFDKSKIMELASKYRVAGVGAEYHDIILPFSKLK